MPRIGKHIHRLGENEAIAACCEELYVSGKGGGVAGDVGDPFGGCMQKGFQYALVRAAAGWVEDRGGEALACAHEAGKLISGVATQKAGSVVQVIAAGVGPGVIYGGAHEFYARGLSAARGGKQGDRTRAAVGVEYALPRLQFQRVQSHGVHALGLCRVDLKETLGQQRKAHLLLYKRLSNGSFQWPRSEAELRLLDPQTFRWLMEGLSMEQRTAIRKEPPKDLF